MGPSDLMAEYAAAWERGDPEYAMSFFADEIVMRLPGRSPLAGVHRGRDAVRGAIDELLARTSNTFPEVEVVDRLESADRVALVLREAVSRDGERLELRRVNVYRVAGEKIVEIEIYEADQYDVDEFFS